MKKLKDKPFALIGVNSLGHKPFALKKAMLKNRITWRTFADDRTIAKQWGLPMTPSFFVIDHEGIIRHKWEGNPGAKTVDAAIERLITRAEAAAAR